MFRFRDQEIVFTQPRPIAEVSARFATRFVAPRSLIDSGLNVTAKGISFAIGRGMEERMLEYRSEKEVENSLCISMACRHCF